MTADVDILTFLYSLFFLSSFLLVHTWYNHILAKFEKKDFLDSLTVSLPAASFGTFWTRGHGGGVWEWEIHSPLATCITWLSYFALSRAFYFKQNKEGGGWHLPARYLMFVFISYWQKVDSVKLNIPPAHWKKIDR